MAAKAGIDYAVVWHHQPKELISRIIGAVHVSHLTFFLINLYYRHASVTVISRNSLTVGLLKNFSRRISRIDAHMHGNEDILEIRQIKELVGMKEPAIRGATSTKPALTTDQGRDDDDPEGSDGDGSDDQHGSDDHRGSDDQHFSGVDDQGSSDGMYGSENE